MFPGNETAPMAFGGPTPWGAGLPPRKLFPLDLIRRVQGIGASRLSGRSPACYPERPDRRKRTENGEHGWRSCTTSRRTHCRAPSASRGRTDTGETGLGPEGRQAQRWMVPGEGVEPSWTRGPRDFESRASTSFTTPAWTLDTFLRQTLATVKRYSSGSARLGPSRGAGERRGRGDKGTRGSGSQEEQRARRKEQSAGGSPLG